MREIKFRAWDKKSQKMIFDIQNNINYGKFSFPFIINNDRFIVMQFTGITDKNKVDIYEGDILENGSYLYYVVYENACFYLYHFNGLEGISGEDYRWGPIYRLSELMICVTVIGNIYTNA